MTRMREQGGVRWFAFGAALLAMMLAACGGGSAPSVAEGGLPVFVVDAPEDVDVQVVAADLLEVIGVADVVDVKLRGGRRPARSVRLDGDGYSGAVEDRGAGSVIVSYSGPRFSNRGCVECPPLEESDTFELVVERSREILEALDVDMSLVTFRERSRDEYELWVSADVSIEGAVFDDLRFNFWWSHGGELVSLTGGLFEVREVGTVAPRDEAEARLQAEQMIGSERSITEFELIYVGAFRDLELVVAPAFEATTDMGTSFTVSGFTGPLPDR